MPWSLLVPVADQAGGSARGNLAGTAQPLETGGGMEEDGGDTGVSRCCAGVRQHPC